MNTRQIKKGEKFTVVLPTNASTGYIWTLKDKENFQLVATKWPQMSLGLGGPVDVEYIFVALNSGEFDFRVDKIRPWEKTNSVDSYVEKLFVS